MAEIRVMRDDLLPPSSTERRHLLSIADLARDDVERLLATARSFARSLEREMKKLPTLRGRTVVNLFYESSTRTSSSFELAAKRLSADTGAIAAADVVYVLRMQQERMQAGANYVPSLREYSARWGGTPGRLRPGQKVMHPGPMNRGVEIDGRVADAADALVETQVRAGLVVRMAVLYDLLTGGARRGPAPPPPGGGGGSVPAGTPRE